MREAVFLIVFCNALVHVISSIESGQYSYRKYVNLCSACIWKFIGQMIGNVI